MSFFLVFCGVLTFLGFTRGRFPVYEFENVKVLKQYDKLNWKMENAEGEFLYTACDDFPNEKVIWAGYIARKARWREEGNCKSIDRKDLGFWYQRNDETGDAIPLSEEKEHADRTAR